MRCFKRDGIGIAAPLVASGVAENAEKYSNGTDKPLENLAREYEAGMWGGYKGTKKLQKAMSNPDSEAAKNRKANV